MNTYTTEQLIALVTAHVPPRHWGDAMVMSIELSFKAGLEIPIEQLRPLEDILVERDEYQNALAFTSAGRSFNRSGRGSYGL